MSSQIGLLSTTYCFVLKPHRPSNESQDIIPIINSYLFPLQLTDTEDIMSQPSVNCAFFVPRKWRHVFSMAPYPGRIIYSVSMRHYLYNFGTLKFTGFLADRERFVQESESYPVLLK
ncbi:hypothetical protein NQ317_005293 [Molorchus minor]|uniref:Uncharacterized protein n=1 Tax=Molorchus minor TaxID=1323400 RepID=A0ABQ9JAT6_9CUCU|nr:hypothetical protein NQ317_005293 [Molorchus minor]